MAVSLGVGWVCFHALECSLTFEQVHFTHRPAKNGKQWGPPAYSKRVGVCHGAHTSSVIVCNHMEYRTAIYDLGFAQIFDRLSARLSAVKNQRKANRNLEMSKCWLIYIVDCENIGHDPDR